MHTKIKAVVMSAIIGVMASGLAVAETDIKINVNTATAEELDKGLIGVGPKIAREIVRHREDHGDYADLSDLDEVKFIGNKMLERNEDRIVFEE